MVLSISRLFLRWRGPKSIANLDGGAIAVYAHGRRLGVEFGGGQNISRTKFPNDLFRNNFLSVFGPENL